MGHFAAQHIADTLVVEEVYDLHHLIAVVIPLKGFQHQRSGRRVKMIELVIVDFIANGSRTASALSFQSVLGLTTNHLFGQLCGIVFRHTFQKGFHQNALRTLGNGFHNGNQMDTVLFQDHLVVCAIKTIPGKAVKFSDKNNIKQLITAVFDHLLELRAIVRFGRECTVNVVFDDRDAVLFRIGRAFPNLPLDGFFALVIR